MISRNLQYRNPLKELFDKSFIKNIPEDAGVYFFLDEAGTPLYIGKADSLKKRLASYFQAKPGQTSDAILEMIEQVRDLQWEVHENGKQALRRESELLRAVRPFYNIVGTEPIEYLFLGLKYSESKSQCQNTTVDFRLSNREIQGDYSRYGCFKHRGKVKSGYMALLRLLFASTCEKERYHFPAKICQSSPPYVYQAVLPENWKAHLDAFLGGTSDELLGLITFKLLEKTNIPEFMYSSLQNDLNIVREFYEIGPSETRKLATRARLHRNFIPSRKMDQLITRQLKRKLATKRKVASERSDRQTATK